MITQTGDTKDDMDTNNQTSKFLDFLVTATVPSRHSSESASVKSDLTSACTSSSVTVSRQSAQAALMGKRTFANAPAVSLVSKQMKFEQTEDSAKQGSLVRNLENHAKEVTKYINDRFNFC